LFFDISPLGNFIIAVLSDHKLLVRRVNQTQNKQSQNTIGYHQSIIFMPIYLDNDYNYLPHKMRYLHTQTEGAHGHCHGSDSDDSLDESTYESRAKNLSKRAVQRAISTFHELTGPNYTSLQQTNDHIVFLEGFLRAFVLNPRQILQLEGKNMHKKLALCFKIYKMFHGLDP
jgi:hypothetical protein